MSAHLPRSKTPLGSNSCSTALTGSSTHTCTPAALAGAPSPGVMSLEPGALAAAGAPNTSYALYDNVHRVPKDEVKVLGRIGEGAFGEVSLATCAIFGKVAVKWLKVGAHVLQISQWVLVAEMILDSLNFAKGASKRLWGPCQCQHYAAC